MSQQFVELLKESTIVQGLLTLVLVGVICYMYLQGMEVPDTLVGILTLVVGFYFGNKTSQQAYKIQSTRKDK